MQKITPSKKLFVLVPFILEKLYPEASDETIYSVVIKQGSIRHKLSNWTLFVKILIVCSCKLMGNFISF